MEYDAINGAFEMLAGLMILNHCRSLYRDKAVKGISILSTVFFFCWGLWNLCYYPALNQTMSFIGGIAVVTANGLWVCMLMYYKRKTDFA